jgi:predicted DNA-binding ribbon-helix-helix protein
VDDISWDGETTVDRRSIVIDGRKTTVSLEDAFWNALKEIATGRNMTRSHLIGAINSGRQQINLSSAVRLFVLGFYKDQRKKAGRGASGHSDELRPQRMGHKRSSQGRFDPYA